MYSKNSVRNVTIVPCQKTFAQFARTTKPREISSTSPRPSDEIPARRCKLTHPARQIARILFASPCLYVPIPHPYSLSLFLSTCFSLERRPKNLYLYRRSLLLLLLLLFLTTRSSTLDTRLFGGKGRELHTRGREVCVKRLRIPSRAIRDAQQGFQRLWINMTIKREERQVEIACYG